MITTNRKQNFSEAQNEIFSWDMYAPNDLLHKASGRCTSQGYWLTRGKYDGRLDAETQAQVMDFWRNLDALKNGIEIDTQPAPAAKGDGWCCKCSTYCYGDCQA
jgi:hypothetical protein